MAERRPQEKAMLLVEPESMLRRTVALTARSLGLADIHEAASITAAGQMLRQQAFEGAIISIDAPANAATDAAAGAETTHDLGLLDLVRGGDSACPPGMPIAVMAENCTGELLAELKQRQVSSVIVKPFRAKILLEAFAALAAVNKPG